MQKPIVEFVEKDFEIYDRQGDVKNIKRLEVAVINYTPKRYRPALKIIGKAALLIAMLLPAACSSTHPLQKLNEDINHNIAYQADSPRSDYWQTPEETLRRGKGDCEDFAILKMNKLPPQYIGSLVLVRVPATQEPHMILRATDRETRQAVYLDNMRDDLVASESFAYHYNHIKTMQAGLMTRQDMIYGSAAE